MSECQRPDCNGVPADGCDHVTRRAARVHIDARTHAEVFDCTLPVPAEHWNGWECPTFDRANAERVIAMATADGQDDYNLFLWTTDREGTDCLLHGTVDGFTIWWEYVGDDKAGYSIGAWSWTWSELDEDAPTDPAALDAYLHAVEERSARYCQVWNAALHAAYAEGADPRGAYRAAQAAVDADPILAAGQ